jgi:pentatricopeptide repeat protein
VRGGFSRSTLISACAKAGEFHEALAAFKAMKAQRLRCGQALTGYPGV